MHGVVLKPRWDTVVFYVSTVWNFTSTATQAPIHISLRSLFLWQSEVSTMSTVWSFIADPQIKHRILYTNVIF